MGRMLERQALGSNTVISAGYDDARQLLELEFRGGRVYRYHDVPRGVFDWLLRTPGKGAYVSRMIANRYPYTALDDDADGAQAEPTGSLEAALRASLQEPPSD